MYKGLCIETQYAKAHIKQGVEYNRLNNQFIAESVAYSMAVKYIIGVYETRHNVLKTFFGFYMSTDKEDNSFRSVVTNLFY